jgi:hypothetical protein
LEHFLKKPELRSASRLAIDRLAKVLSARVVSLSLDHGTEGALSFLEREGYYVGLRLAQDTLSSLLAQARITTCYGDGNLGMPYRAEERGTAEQRYQCSFERGSYLSQHERWEAFQALREDRRLLALATRYLACTPTYQRSEILWTYPRSAAPGSRTEPPAANESVSCSGESLDPQQAPIRRLTFTFYLTDVATSDGPQTYIRRSLTPCEPGADVRGRDGRGSSEKCARARSDQLVNIYGPRGLGFAGDPRLLSRCASPALREHLTLQIELTGRGQPLH